MHHLLDVTEFGSDIDSQSRHHLVNVTDSLAIIVFFCVAFEQLFTRQINNDDERSLRCGNVNVDRDSESTRSAG